MRNQRKVQKKNRRQPRFDQREWDLAKPDYQLSTPPREDIRGFNVDGRYGLLDLAGEPLVPFELVKKLSKLDPASSLDESPPGLQPSSPSPASESSTEKPPPVAFPCTLSGYEFTCPRWTLEDQRLLLQKHKSRQPRRKLMHMERKHARFIDNVAAVRAADLQPFDFSLSVQDAVSDDDEDDDEPVRKSGRGGVAAGNTRKRVNTDSEEEDDDSSDKRPTKQPRHNEKNDAPGGDSDHSDSDDDDGDGDDHKKSLPKPAAKPAAKAPGRRRPSSKLQEDVSGIKVSLHQHSIDATMSLTLLSFHAILQLLHPRSSSAAIPYFATHDA